MLVLSNVAANRRRNRGFTLMELLVVVTIICLLVGLLVPSLYRAILRARVAAVKAQLMSLQTALFDYSQEQAWAGAYPASNLDSDQNSSTSTITGPPAINPPFEFTVGYYKTTDPQTAALPSGSQITPTGDDGRSTGNQMSGAQLLRYFTNGNRQQGGFPIKRFGATTFVGPWFNTPKPTQIGELGVKAAHCDLTGVTPIDASGNTSYTVGSTTIRPLNEVYVDELRGSGLPILYFKGNKYGDTNPANLSNDLVSPNLMNSGNSTTGKAVVYRFADNAKIWNKGTRDWCWQTPAGAKEAFGIAAGLYQKKASPNFGTQASPSAGFTDFKSRPVNADSFLLISPGLDGKYGINPATGSSDDIMNVNADPTTFTEQ